MQTEFTLMFDLRHPIIMAPMFLVSNEAMMEAAMGKGIMGVFPSLNFREGHELEKAIQNLHEYKSRNGITKGNFGVNLIVQRTNLFYKKHLDICVRSNVSFYITSLGNPREVIEAAHSYGAKVFCDVTNMQHAEKCVKEGCDGFIAVGQGAGGHSGPYPNMIMVPALKKNFPHIPVVAAGGVATGAGILSMLVLGADAVSIGTKFIASPESPVRDAYKKAVIDSHMSDIVMSERISGTPCTIINTPFAKKIGYRQNRFEKFLSSNPRTKKYYKMLVQVRGMKWLENAVKPGNYNNLWCAGQSVEFVNEIKPCSEIIDELVREMEETMRKICN